MTSTTPEPTGELQTKTTFCRVCHASCPMEVDVVDNRVIAVRGVMDDPLFEGYTCIKGRQIPDQMADPNRLRAPLRRRQKQAPGRLRAPRRSRTPPPAVTRERPPPYCA